MRNRLSIFVAAALIAGGGFAFAQGVSPDGAAAPKSATKTEQAAPSGSTGGNTKAHSSANQPRDAKGRFMKKTPETSAAGADTKAGTGTAASGADTKTGTGAAASGTDTKGMGAAAASGGNVPNRETTGIGSQSNPKADQLQRAGDQLKGASANNKAGNGMKTGAKASSPNWIKRALKAGEAARTSPQP